MMGTDMSANALTVSLFERVEHAVEVAVFFIYARDKESWGIFRLFARFIALVVPKCIPPLRKRQQAPSLPF